MEELTQYTVTLVTYIPLTQTITVEADCEDDALDLAYEQLDYNTQAWTLAPDFVISLDSEIDILSCSPRDDEEN